MHVRANSTVDVDFVDGTSDQRLDPHFIRYFNAKSRTSTGPGSSTISPHRNRMDRDTNERNSPYNDRDSRVSNGGGNRSGGRGDSSMDYDNNYNRTKSPSRSNNKSPKRYNRGDDNTDDDVDVPRGVVDVYNPSPSRESNRRERGRDDNSGPSRSRISSSPLGRRQNNNTSIMAFTSGDDVECDINGKGNWKLGRVKLARSDGTFDIRVDDIREEINVPLDCLRPITKGNRRGRNVSASREREGRSVSPNRAMQGMKITPDRSRYNDNYNNDNDYME